MQGLQKVWMFWLWERLTKKSGQEFLPACPPRRPKWPSVAILVYFPEVVEVLAGCAFALGMLT